MAKLFYALTLHSLKARIRSMQDNSEERLVALETKLSYLEDYVNKLQDVAVSQSKEIDVLREENRVISARFRELLDSLEDIPNRKPPHY